MSRDDGFTIGDRSTRTLYDLRLVRAVRRVGLCAIVAWDAVVDASWEAGRRVCFEDAVDTLPFQLGDVQAIKEALTAEGLMEDGLVREASWLGWFGVASTRRDLKRERDRRYNANRTAPRRRRNGARTSDVRSENGAPDRTDRSGPSSPSVPTVLTAPTGGNARATWTNGDDEPEYSALQWLAQHQATLEPNGNGLHSQLCRLVELHGIRMVLATFEDLARNPANRTPRQYILGADNQLNRIQSAPAGKPETDEERSIRMLRERGDEIRRRTQA